MWRRRNASSDHTIDRLRSSYPGPFSRPAANYHRGSKGGELRAFASRPVAVLGKILSAIEAQFASSYHLHFCAAPVPFHDGPVLMLRAQQQVTDLVGNHVAEDFARGDSRIEFGEPADLAVSLATGKVKTVEELSGQPLYGLSVSPDGWWLVYAQTEHKGSDLWTVEHFTPGF